MIVKMAKKVKRIKRALPISEQLRKAILTCGQTRYRISQITGISEGTLSKFIHHQHGLSQEKIDLLGTYLGLRLESDGQQTNDRK
jgi:plasmid maintenance system antidote protein VapI